ncbi:MAG: flagellar hook-length control protein FliK [Treponema sp.]|nr:flagellar hook-length control protein FliK [Treponema sp.]
MLLSPVAELALAPQEAKDRDSRPDLAEESGQPSDFSRIFAGILAAQPEGRPEAQSERPAQDSGDSEEGLLSLALALELGQASGEAPVPARESEAAPEQWFFSLPENPSGALALVDPELALSDEALAQAGIPPEGIFQAIASAEKPAIADGAPALAQSLQANPLGEAAQAARLHPEPAQAEQQSAGAQAELAKAPEGPMIEIVSATGARDASNGTRSSGEGQKASLDFAQGPAKEGAQTAQSRDGGAAFGQEQSREGLARRGTAATAREARVAATRAEGQGASPAAQEAARAPAEGSAAREAAVDLRAPAQNGHSAAATAWEARPSQAMENMLARDLGQRMNVEIARQATIILRDGGEGIIRLALRPESLGHVKISLEMAENKITGRIVVQSEEALRAFERELDSLKEELRAAGFAGADLQMSLAEKDAEERWQEIEDGRAIPLRLAASRYDDSSETIDDAQARALYWHGQRAVDMLA